MAAGLRSQAGLDLARRVPATQEGTPRVKHKMTTRPVQPSDHNPSLTSANRRQVLVVEPDKLTEWSLRTYLGKWFSVHSTNSTESAERVLAAHAVDVLVVSGDLSSTALTALEVRAREFHEGVVIVRLVTEPGSPEVEDQAKYRLEKPFALEQLARLLGVSAEELPRE